MNLNICSIQEKRLVDRLQFLKIKGEVIGKKAIKLFGDQPERKVVVIKFRDRTIEKETDESEFGRTQIGEYIWFTPPVPECDPCNFHLFVWLVVAFSVGALAIWAITSHFEGRIATLLALAAVGWSSVIAGARICSNKQNKFLRDLEMEIDFFNTEGEHARRDRE